MNPRQTLPVLALIAICFSTLGPVVCRGGDITGTINRLDGLPRGGIDLEYEVFGRVVSSNQRYVVKPKVSTATNSVGGYRLIVPNAAASYRTGTREVFVVVQSPGLQTVELSFLLGTQNHRVNLVMRDAAYKAMQLPAFAFQGNRGTFHLIGNNGTGLYCDERGCYQLSTLEFTDEDQHFTYFQEIETDRRWAFAANPRVYYRCWRGCWIRTETYRVWTWTPEAGKWRRFDDARKIVPLDR